MAEYDINGLTSGASDRPETVATIHCRLFSDEITRYICSLRKRELSVQEGFSCEGCPQAG